MAPLPSSARMLSEQLAAQALHVCRTYLSRGRRCGRYWTVGDVLNSPGRSLFVRLTGPLSGPGAAGRWCDAATGEHGDLLDLLRARLALRNHNEALAEARRCLALPPTVADTPRTKGTSAEAAHRLFAVAGPITGTHAEGYLQARGLGPRFDHAALRFHPRVFCRELGPGHTLPALLATITDEHGRITAIQRTWLDPARPAKADLQAPRRSMGRQIGHGVRFGTAHGTVLAGEGIETVLSLHHAFPALAMIAALSATQLGSLELPAGTRRLLIARDGDVPGRRAATRLRGHAEARGIAVRELAPVADDFNADLARYGLDALRRRVLRQGLRVEQAPKRRHCSGHRFDGTWRDLA